MARKAIGRSIAKRLLDLSVATFGMVVGAPLIAGVAIAVRVRLGTPVLHRQERAGRAAVPISVPKFRSMSDARDVDGSLLPDDQRLTRFGRLLRSTSLDELPQLWTVVKGDMSLVGPRPLPMPYVARYSPEQRRRLDVKPGITGWAQVNGRNALSWPDKLALDVWYVEHVSLWLDVRILARTVKSALRPSGVSADGHATMPEFMGEP